MFCFKKKETQTNKTPEHLLCSGCREIQNTGGGAGRSSTRFQFWGPIPATSLERSSVESGVCVCGGRGRAPVPRPGCAAARRDSPQRCRSPRAALRGPAGARRGSARGQGARRRLPICQRGAALPRPSRHKSWLTIVVFKRSSAFKYFFVFLLYCARFLLFGFALVLDGFI